MIPVFSIILPVYNQADQIENFYLSYDQALKELGQDYEILFIVNGSADDSMHICKSLASEKEYVHAFELPSAGWGKAVIFGLSKARGRFLCYTNTARTTAKDLCLLLKYAFINEKTIVKANRIVRDSFLRKLGSVLFNLEYRLLFRIPVWDVNGTPKVLPRNIYEELDLVFENDLIDAEIIARCYRKRIPFVDVPVLSTIRISGKSTTTLRSAFKLYFGLFRLKRSI
jgi:glycosyltransferase involved in cell wall biosynthesis